MGLDLSHSNPEPIEHELVGEGQNIMIFNHSIILRSLYVFMYHRGIIFSDRSDLLLKLSYPFE